MHILLRRQRCFIAPYPLLTTTGRGPLHCQRIINALLVIQNPVKQTTSTYFNRQTSDSDTPGKRFTYECVSLRVNGVMLRHLLYQNASND